QQEIVLLDGAHLRTQRILAYGAEIKVIHQNSPGVRQIKLLQKRNHGRFSTARLSHQRYELPGLGYKRDFAKDGPSRFIRKCHRVKFNTATNVGQDNRTRWIFPGRREIDEQKEPLSSSHGCQCLVVLISNHLDWLKKE